MAAVCVTVCLQAGRLRVEKTVAEALWAHYTSSRGFKKVRVHLHYSQNLKCSE